MSILLQDSATVMNAILLSDLSIPQIDNVLSKLQLSAPTGYDAEDRLTILQCSKIYMRYLSSYEFDAVFANFDIRGNFIDFETTDKVVTGLFPKKNGKNTVLYPCVVCSDEVTDKNDKSGFGLNCNGCENFFHNSCNDHPISLELYNNLKDSPSFVKTFCCFCNRAMQNVVERLSLMDKKMNEIKSEVEILKQSSEEKDALYSSKVKNGKSENDINAKLTKQIAAQQKVLKTEETEERNKRTLLIRKPMDVNIINSKTLRSSFNKEFPGVVIKNCRITAGGSFKVELDKEDEVKKVSSQWRNDSFGGNKGVASPMDMQTSGIIKHVYVDQSERVIEEDIRSKYPCISKVEFFKRNGTFHGTIKVVFKSRKDLLDVMADRVKIFNQRYLMEEFKPLPRVIKCNRCQAFGHIARRCRAAKPTCGKCGEESHETMACSSSARKCTHCKEGHETGDKNCKIMKEKLAEIKQRSQYGL